MALPDRFLDEIRSRIGLAEVVGRRVRLIRKGREFSGLCPFHNEKTPSFTVSEEKGFYHCFGCGAHGDVISFVMRSENLSFPEAVERLAGEAGLEVPRASPQERERERRRAGLHDVTEAAAAWFEKQLRLPAGRAALDYLRRRGLEEETIARFRLGFAPDQGRDRAGGLKAALTGDGMTEAMLVEAGLLVQPEDGRGSYDRFRNRVIFPIADRRGRIIAFGGRILGEGEPKYLNSPETPLFHKGRVLYGLAQARRPAAERGELIVTEGYMDVIALSRAGFDAAVAPLGTALTEEQMQELWRLVDEPVLCFDGDAAGQRAAARAAERALALLKPGRSLRFAFMPGGEDPDSLIAGQGAAVMRGILDAARPLVDMIWEMETALRPVDTPERRADLQARLGRRVAAIAEGSVRGFYQEAFRERLWAAFHRPFRRAGRGAGKERAGGGGTLPNLRSGALAAGNAALRRRRQQIILTTLLNHPDLIDEFAEELAQVELDPDLDKLRQDLHHLWSSVGDLDAERLKLHFMESDSAGLLRVLLGAAVLQHAAFARPDQPVEAAREGLRHTIALLMQARRREEVQARGRAAAGDATEESEASFLAFRSEVERGESDVAEVDGVLAGPNEGK